MEIDEIIEEVRGNREAHAAKFSYDLRAIYEDLKKSETDRINSGHPFSEPTIRPAPGSKPLHRSAAPLPIRSDGQP